MPEVSALAKRASLPDVSRFVFIAALIWAAPAAAQTTYFASIEDLPLPAGFAESTGGWSMQTEAGALTEVRAAGRGSIEQVRAFYDLALPALGWSHSPQLDQSLVFQRGRERLMFGFGAPGDGAVTIRVRLLTQTASMNAD